MSEKTEENGARNLARIDRLERDVAVLAALAERRDGRRPELVRITEAYEAEHPELSHRAPAQMGVLPV